MSAVAAANDSDDLQALFDSIVTGRQADAVATSTAPAAPIAANAPSVTAEPAQDLLTKIGHLTRSIHDNLRELGYDRKLEEAAASIPDARERLTYVANLTERAAIRVMNATDVARPIQEQLASGASALAGRWRAVFSAQSSVDEFKALAASTLAYLDEVPRHTQATNAQLMEIVMAQDFQDLTGQVIKRINDLAHRWEQELLVLLLENMPAEQRPVGADGLLNGPVVNVERAGEVVTTQAQVDDLLESLGF
jgi:chemotaxis protein CheZ